MSNSWSEQLRDAILSNSALREGIHDDAAQSLIDWALQLADDVTEGLPSMPDSVAEMRFEALSEALPKLIQRITWVVVYHQKKGPDWTTRTLNQLNELNVTLHGADAPQLSEMYIMQMANQEGEQDTGAQILALMNALQPPAPELPENGEEIL